MKVLIWSYRIRSYSGLPFPAFRPNIAPYSVWMRENADQNNSEHEHFLRSDFVNVFIKISLLSLGSPSNFTSLDSSIVKVFIKSFYKYHELRPFWVCIHGIDFKQAFPLLTITFVHLVMSLQKVAITSIKTIYKPKMKILVK